MRTCVLFASCLVLLSCLPTCLRSCAAAHSYNVERSIELRASREPIAIVQDPSYRRLKSTADMDVCFAVYFDPLWYVFYK